MICKQGCARVEDTRISLTATAVFTLEDGKRSDKFWNDQLKSSQKGEST